MKIPFAIVAFCLAAVALAPSAPAAGRRCVALGPLPDPVCTPGAVQTTDAELVCGQSTRERRHVTERTKRAVREAYGIADGVDVEIDHLVPLELGGSNDVSNLWPQPAGPMGYRVKDHVEDVLHREVCAGARTLEDAQRSIASDWTKAVTPW